MKVGGQIAIAGVATLSIVGLMVFFAKKASASTSSSNGGTSSNNGSSSGNKSTNTPPPPPPPRLGDAASLANNYVIMTYYIIKRLNDVGHTQEGNELLAQLSNAWAGSKEGIPAYDNSTVLAAWPKDFNMFTNNKAVFSKPSVMGMDMSGDQSHMLLTAYGNALQMLAAITKNTILLTDQGDAVAVRIGYVIGDYTDAAVNIKDEFTVQERAAKLIQDYNWELNEDWPRCHGGASNHYSDTKTIIQYAVQAVGLLAALA